MKYRWRSEARTELVELLDNGEPTGRIIPLGSALLGKLANPEIGAEAATFEDPIAPEPSAVDVSQECERRILGRVSVFDQINLLADTVSLLSVGASRWTTEQRQRFVAASNVWAWIAAMVARSDALKADPPTDFRDDKIWPRPPEQNDGEHSDVTADAGPSAARQ